MKTLLTLDEAFSGNEFELTQAALFNASKLGIFDPTFLPLVKNNAKDFVAKYQVEKLGVVLTQDMTNFLTRSLTKTTSIFVQ